MKGGEPGRVGAGPGGCTCKKKSLSRRAEAGGCCGGVLGKSDVEP